MADPRPSRVHYEGSQPILRVENMQPSLRFYVGVLGFTNAPWGNDDFTSVNRDRAGIYLCRGGQGRGGAWVWLGVEDVALIYEGLKSRGVPIRMAPTNYSWALEMQIEDPDGNVLRLGVGAEGGVVDRILRDNPAKTARELGHPKTRLKHNLEVTIRSAGKCLHKATSSTGPSSQSSPYETWGLLEGRSYLRCRKHTARSFS